MLAQKPPMGWNSWNTFATDINEELILQMADTMVEKGYKDAGYEYLIIDDCWALKKRVDGKITPDPTLFPHGMKYVADYVHSKGLKFGMYSCAGFLTCEGYPGSYGYEFEDARQFAQWGVDYLKYDFCNFPSSGDGKNAYLTMSMALRSTGRDILFAACNWGTDDPSSWMRSRGAHTYRSTGDIVDTPKSYMDIFKGQCQNIEGNAPGCYNDFDMLTVGMHGKGFVGLGGCTSEQYLQHFAMWSFLGSPLIIGGDIRNLCEEDEKILKNPDLIAINQDEECRPPFLVSSKFDKIFTFAKLLSGGRFAVAFFTLPGVEKEWDTKVSICFDDLGIHSESGISVRVRNAITGEDFGICRDGFRTQVKENECGVFICEPILK